jgi:GT2 family glycosyltransferase
LSVRQSVVIPVFGRAALTERCLETVLATVPAGTEVVVVDDASPDETLAVLAAFGEAIRVVALPHNGGFARACNSGAAAARGDLLVFLNNDTEPQPGWLDALLAYADSNPGADVVGAKLLYPNGSVQHAGVVFGQDGYPHHLYAGLPADHPAVNRSRPLQAVTAACMLVRRTAFEGAGGFDDGYENSLEDVDLCLRLGERGGSVHYCHSAELLHLESASRGRQDRFETSLDRYRERWRQRVHRDDLEIYAADRLLSVEYPASYPVRMAISPLLSVVDRGREEEIERLLETYARQVSDLLQEVVRLTAGPPPAPTDDSPTKEPAAGDHRQLLDQARRIEAEIQQLQLLAEQRGDGFESSPRLGYRELVEQVRRAVEEHIPPGATVLVVSRGDRELIRFDGRRGEHFPQEDDGQYAGHHPADSAEAIARLEQMRERGARYLVLPSSAEWWLGHYDGFVQHLTEQGERLDSDACVIFRLSPHRPSPAQHRS